MNYRKNNYGQLIYKVAFLLILLVGMNQTSYGQAKTIADGDFDDDDVWADDDVPNLNGDDVIIYHNIYLDKNLNIKQDFDVLGSLTGESNKNIVGKSSGTVKFAGLIDIDKDIVIRDDATLTVESGMVVNARSVVMKHDAVVLIKSGAVVTVEKNFFGINNAVITIEEGATVNVEEDFKMKNDAQLNLNGDVYVTEQTKVENDAVVNGSGSLTSGDEVVIKNDGLLFEQTEEKEYFVYRQGCCYSATPTVFDGSAGSDWFNSSNWSNGVPTYEVPAVISASAATMPIISEGGAQVFHLSIESGASLTISDENSLDIYGSLNNAGSFNANQSTVRFVGSCAQTQLSNPSVTVFHNIVVDHDAIVQMSAGGVNLKGTIDILGGTFASNGAFRIVSDADGTGRIGEILGDAFTGNVIVERYIDAGETYWRYIASAVTGATLYQFNDDFTTTGYPGSSYPSFGWTSVYTYDETLGPGAGYVPAASGEQVMGVGEGYQIYSGDASSGTSAFTFDLVGVPNQGTINLPVSFTYTGTAAEDGFCLVGNPYASTIDWENENWTKTNMDDATYIQDPDTKLYATYIDGASANGGSQYIASQQSFWVKANASSPTLTIREACKVSDDIGFKSSVPNPGCNIKISGMGVEDEAVLRNKEGTSDSFEGNADAEKKWGGWGVNPQLTLVNNDAKDLTVHTFDFGFDEHSVPLRAVVFTSGEYTLEFTNVEELAVPCMILEDTYTGETYDISEGEELTFTLSDTSWAPRFYLHTGKNYNFNMVDNLCNGEEEGQIIVDLGMETVDYQLAVVGDTTEGSGPGNPLVITDLKSAYYHLIPEGLDDMCGASEFVILVNQPAPIEVETTIKHAISGNDGSLEVEVDGGVPPLTLDWSTGSDSALVTGLAAGTYMLMVTDANGCEVQNYYKINTLTEQVGPVHNQKFIHDALNKRIYINEWKFSERELILYNDIGQIIAKYPLQIETNTIEIDLPSHIAKGMYILATPNGEFSEKIVVR